MKNLNGKYCVVTGAGKGIGRAIAERFLAEEAAGVAILEWDLALAEATAKDLDPTGERVIAIKCNVADSDMVKAAIDTVVAKFGRVDVLVNNAGIAHIGLLSEMTDKEWNRIIQTNLSSVFYCSRAVIPEMVSKKSGKIINISSMWGTAGASCEAAYSATKAGVHGLTKALAKELAPSNIQVNAIACGVIDTAMNQQLSEEDKIVLKNEIPASRFGTPEELKKLIDSYEED